MARGLEGKISLNLVYQVHPKEYNSTKSKEAKFFWNGFTDHKKNKNLQKKI